MIVEIAAGIVFGSMALLADGLHMGSHASALAIAAFAYRYTRSHAKDARFCFGTGKVNSLAAFASAVMLAVFALVMAWESVRRLLSPVTIEFNQAILVAVLGLVVNGVCLVILGGHHHHVGKADRHRHHKHHEHGDDLGPAHHDGHGHDHHRHDAGRRDLNLWSAYLHVLADAMTSLLAIFALLAGKHLGYAWLDPFMGVAGAILIVRWAWGLLRSSGQVLLDMQAPEELRVAIRQAIEAHADNRVADLHVWAIGVGIYAAEMSVVTSVPDSPDHYAKLLPPGLPLIHVTTEVHTCPSCFPEPGINLAANPTGGR
jgi:cation diffusion facilitator family transporter